MKFLAILKDSLREALDTKVLYVMVALSGLVILVTASLSFKPRSVTDLAPILTGTLNLKQDDVAGEEMTRIVMHGVRQGDDADFVVVGQQPFDGESDGPQSKFIFTVRSHFSTPGQAEQVRSAPQEIEKLIRRRFGRIGAVEVMDITDVRPAAPAGAGGNDVLFEVRTQPTPATIRLWPHEVSVFFGALPLFEAPLGMQLYIMMGIVVNGMGGWVILLVSVIMTAFFVPNMLRKGTIDLLLVKPIHRGTLLFYKYTGGLIFIFLNTAVAVAGVWLVLGLRSGIWANSFLLSIFVYTFFFAILYAVSTLFAVLTRSPVVAILVTLAAWFCFFLVGTIYASFENERRVEAQTEMAAERRWGDNTFGKVVDAVHFVLPRTKDLDILQDSLLLADLLTANEANTKKIHSTSITWSESLTVSAVFIAIMLGLSCWWFVTRDY